MSRPVFPAIIHSTDEGDFVEVRLRVDVQTAMWASSVADAAHSAPEVIMASVLRGVREDDEAEHRLDPENVTIN